MREFIIVTVLCLVAAVVADAVWFDGKYFGRVKDDIGFSFSSVNRH
jgi:hypothetical protein